MIEGDFYGILGIPEMWTNEEDVEKSKVIAKIVCGFFTYSAMCAFISIIQTIRTDPGSIPDKPEWQLEAYIETEESNDANPKRTDNIF